MGHVNQLKYLNLPAISVKISSYNNRYIMYIMNDRLHRELGIPTVMEEIKATTLQKRFEEYLNQLAPGLMNPKRVFWRLKKKTSQDLII